MKQLLKENAIHYSFQFIGIIFWVSITSYQWYIYEPERLTYILTNSLINFITLLMVSFIMINVFYAIHKSQRTSLIILFVFLYTLTCPTQWIFISNVLKKLFWPNELYALEFFSLTKTTLTHFFFFFGLLGIYYLVKYWQNLQAQKERTLQAINLVQESKLLMLRYQINPHFLFNAFSSIQALIDEDKIKARQTLSELSKFFRYTLQNSDKDKVDLQEEIKAIKHYLDIQKIRFEDKIDIQYQIDEIEIEIPFLILLPLVENAIKFGMQTSPKPLRINIQVFKKDNSHFLMIRNSHNKLKLNKTWDQSQTESHFIGLNNIKERLQLYYPDKHKFEISESDEWYSVRIELSK